MRTFKRTLLLVILYVLMPLAGYTLMRHQSSLGLLLGLILLVSFAVITIRMYRNFRKSLTNRKSQA